MVTRMAKKGHISLMAQTEETLTDGPPSVIGSHHVDSIEKVVLKLLDRVGAGKATGDA